MSFIEKIFIASSVALLSSAASAQIITSAPFTGQHSEDLESSPYGSSTCVPGRVFGNTADLCDPVGNGLIVTSGWSFMCQIGTHGGVKLAGSSGGPAEFRFDQPATRFGGFFGTNCGSPDATVEFYDINNALITSLTATIPANCTWSWSGWQVVGGPAIKRVKLIGLNPYGGGFVDMDDVQVDYGIPCPLPVNYCSPKVNSLGCIPSIQWAGTPSASAFSGCMMKGVNVRNNKPGLLIYSVTGRASTPFQGGVLCLQLPIKRTPPGNSGGSAAPASDCSGVYSIDVNTLAHGGLGGGQPLAALLVPGTIVDCQFWGIDPGFPAPNNTTLSDGLEYIVCP